MRNKNPLSHDFRSKAGPKPEAVLAYDRVEHDRRSGRKGHRLEHLSLLAPFMPGLDKSDIARKDKKYIYMMYINLLMELRDFEAALECSTAAFNFDDRDIRTIAKRAGILRRLGKNDDAVIAYKQGLRIAPEDKTLLTELGRTYMGMNDIASALVYLKKANRIDPKDEFVRECIQNMELNSTPAPCLTPGT